MPVKKIDRLDFCYIHYVRQSPKDVEDFRREVTNAMSLNSSLKDVVVDFTGANIVSSPELSILVRLIKSFQGSQRVLRVIAPLEIRKLISSTNISRLKNIVVYEDHDKFIASWKEIAASSIKAESGRPAAAR